MSNARIKKPGAMRKNHQKNCNRSNNIEPNIALFLTNRFSKADPMCLQVVAAIPSMARIKYPPPP